MSINWNEGNKPIQTVDELLECLNRVLEQETEKLLDRTPRYQETVIILPPDPEMRRAAILAWKQWGVDVEAIIAGNETSTG